MIGLKHLLTVSLPILTVFPALFPAAAPGSVNFNLTDNDATPTTASVGKGGTVPFTLNLTTTAGEKTTAVDYFLQSSTSNVFTISTRNTASSAYPDPYTSDATITSSGSNPGLNPRNGSDLGGTVTNPSMPTTGAGPFKVADFVLSVSASAPAGVYTISTFTNPGVGWVDQNFNDNSINTQGSFTITVTPEPAGAAVAGLGLFLLGRRRRPA